MKKKIASIALAIALILTLQTTVSAVYVSFLAEDNGEKLGHMTGVKLDNGVIDIDIVDDNASDGIDPNNMTKTGYTFAGWVEHEPTPNSNILTIDNENNTIAFNANGDGQPRSVYATWKLIEYKINLDLGYGGTSDIPETYTVESPQINFTDPERPGFIFKGWVDGEGNPLQNEFIPTGAIGDVTLKALWEAIPYTISYDYDGGTAENPETYTADDEITLNNPTKEGYTFAGWEEFGDPVGITYKIEKGTTGDIRLRATWTKDEYTIEYDLDGGKVEKENPATYTVDDEFTLNNPTKDGYTFAGWTNEAGEDLGTTVKVAKGTTGDLKFIAKWTSNNPKTSDGIFTYIVIFAISTLGLAVCTKKLFIK